MLYARSSAQGMQGHVVGGATGCTQHHICSTIRVYIPRGAVQAQTLMLWQCCLQIRMGARCEN